MDDLDTMESETKRQRRQPPDTRDRTLSQTRYPDREYQRCRKRTREHGYSREQSDDRSSLNSGSKMHSSDRGYSCCRGDEFQDRGYQLNFSDKDNADSKDKGPQRYEQRETYSSENRRYDNHRANDGKCAKCDCDYTYSGCRFMWKHVRIRNPPTYYNTSNRSSTRRSRHSSEEERNTRHRETRPGEHVSKQSLTDDGSDKEFPNRANEYDEDDMNNSDMSISNQTDRGPSMEKFEEEDFIILDETLDEQHARLEDS